MGRFVNPNKTELLRLAREIDATNHVYAEILFGVSEEQHSVVPIHGNTGTGKSTIMQKLASLSYILKYYMKNINAEHLVTWSPAQSCALAQLGYLKRWNDMSQDEYRSRNIGTGSVTSDQGFRALTETLRADKNSFFVCSVHDKDLAPHFSLKSVGWKREFKHPTRGMLYNVNEAIVYGPEHELPLGYVYLDEGIYRWIDSITKQEVTEAYEGRKYKVYDSPGMWPIQPYIIDTYYVAKNEYMDQVKRFGGNPQEYDPRVVEWAKQQLLEFLDEHYSEDMYELQAAEIKDIYMHKANLPAVFYMENVISTVRIHLNEKKKAIQRAEADDILRREAEKEAREEELIKQLIPRYVEYAKARMDPDKPAFPPTAVCYGWLRRMNGMLDESKYKHVYRGARILWFELQSDRQALERAKESALRPPPIPIVDFDFSDRFWYDFVRDKYESRIDIIYWNSYEKYAIEERAGWTSQEKVVKQLEEAETPRARWTIRKHFKRIEGMMKREMGYEYERSVVKYYSSPEMLEAGFVVMDAIASKDLKPDEDFEARKQREPDLVLRLPDESIAVISIKTHSKEASIDFEGPELKLYNELLKDGKDTVLFLQGTYKQRFFSIEIDPSKIATASVRITDEHYLQWPPNTQEIFRARASKAEMCLEYLGEGSRAVLEEGLVAQEDEEGRAKEDETDEKEEEKPIKVEE